MPTRPRKQQPEEPLPAPSDPFAFSSRLLSMSTTKLLGTQVRIDAMVSSVCVNLSCTEKRLRTGV